jgi:UDP-3-O-[3-hydroxymyristoyl] N-acetylglucosamine deacetylase
MAYRRTLTKPVGCTGIGLHSGKPVRLELKPAPAGHGVKFRRTDLGGIEIPASLEYLASLDHATSLSSDGISVGTVEHLLSALYALGVDDILVEVDGPEVPVLDGSAAPFVILIHEAGLKPQAAPRRFLKILGPVEVVRGGRWIRISPADQFRVSYSIGFEHPLLRHQAASFRITRDTFEEAIAPARTFGFLRDVETMRRSGLALGGSLENAVVIGETGVLNTKLRFEDEFVRHKILDVIGDFALLGHPVIGHIEACKAGHGLHTALAQKLMSRPEAFSLVGHPQLPVLDVAPAPRLALEAS